MTKVFSRVLIDLLCNVDRAFLITINFSHLTSTYCSLALVSFYILIVGIVVILHLARWHWCRAQIFVSMFQYE